MADEIEKMPEENQNSEISQNPPNGGIKNKETEKSRKASPNGEKKNGTKAIFRLDKKLKSLIETQAILDGTSESDIIRKALSAYLTKDTNYKAQVEVSLENLKKDVLKMTGELELFSSLFKFWTQYYFTLTTGLGNLSNEQKKIKMETGKNQSKRMMDAFFQTVKDKKTGLVESLVADYMIFEKENAK